MIFIILIRLSCNVTVCYANDPHQAERNALSRVINSKFMRSRTNKENCKNLCNEGFDHVNCTRVLIIMVVVIITST